VNLPENPRIGIVGLGRMGANMARRLQDKGYCVSMIFDSNPEAASAAGLGCPIASTVAAVTQAADVIITVVTDDAAMRRIFFDHTDALLSGASGKSFINCATISPSLHQEIEAAAQAVGASTLEACMASSITQAREGTLYLMCAGRRDVFETLQPILAALSTKCRYVGVSGKAAEVKALVNMVMNINTAGLAEGLGLGDALGIDLATLRAIFSETGANSRVLETDGEDMQNRDHVCFFSAAHAAKDSAIALSLAKQSGVALPLSAASHAQFARMVERGLGELDKSGVAELTFLGRSGD